MSSGNTCRECGTAIPADSPGGFCAQCLMGLGLAEVQSQEPEVAKSLSEKPGDRIGRYRLLQEIGHGGCGVVYMAEQEEPVRRKVALKVIKLGMDTKQVVARFEAERQALALMDHPNIAKIYDAGVTEAPLPASGHPLPSSDEGRGQGEGSSVATRHSSLVTSAGRPYFVMELVGGIKITDYCDQNNLTTRQRLDLFIQICRAIQHAHQKGIIHRDIKPSNVLVTTHDGAAVPKVIDFGIAKATEGRLTDQTLFTAFEQFIGTPAYMSPEQAQLGGLDVDTRSDIYSLGVLLYELLTSKTPFDAKELLAAGLEAMRRTICEKEPPKPSTRLTRELMAADAGRLTSKSEIGNRKSKIAVSSRRLLQTKELVKLLRGDLDWIVMKCLEKDRARRYETANGLAVDLQRHLNQEPVVARPPSKIYQFQKFVRRNQVTVVFVTLIATALMLGIVASTWQAIRARQAEREQSRLREEAQKAKQDATEKLRASYLAEARARRLSGKSGQHFESLRAIREATAIHPSLDLRNEAIASMVLADIQFQGEKNFSKAKSSVRTGGPLENYSVIEPSGTVKIRRVSDDTELASLPDIGKTPRDVGQFSPDGKFVIVGYADDRGRVWDWAAPSVVVEVAAPHWSHGFSADGKKLAASDGTNIVIYNLAGGENAGTIPLSGLSPLPAPASLQFDPSGRRLAIIIGTGTNVIILDIESGRSLMTLPHDDYIASIAWHPDGRHLATTGGTGLISIWDTATGEVVKTLPSEQSVSLSFSHQGNFLVASGWDGKTRLLSFPSCRQLASIDTAGYILGISPDDHRLATGTWDGTCLKFFAVESGKGLLAIHENQQWKGIGGAASFSANGRLLACPTVEGVKVWDVREGRDIGSLPGEDITPIGFDAQDRNLLVMGPKGILRCALRESFPGGPLELAPPVLALARSGGAAVSADGRICAVVEEKKWRFFRTDSFAELAATVPRPGAFGAAFSPDGSLFAVGARWHPGVTVWNAANGALVRELPAANGYADTSANVAFSPDGRHLVTSIMSAYCFWEMPSWSLTRRIPQPKGNDFPARMAFSPDGKVFAGTHSHNVVRLYDAASAQVLADLEAPNSKLITSLCFNHDGTLLAACESRNVLRLWDLRAIREQLAEMNLDWEMPPYPSPSTAARLPPR